MRNGGHVTVDQPFGAVGPEVPAELVELLARVAHHAAGLGDVVELGRKIEQRELAACYILIRGHDVSLGSDDGLAIAILNPPEPHGRTRSLRSARDPNCQVNTISGHSKYSPQALPYSSQLPAPILRTHNDISIHSLYNLSEVIGGHVVAQFFVLHLETILGNCDAKKLSSYKTVQCFNVFRLPTLAKLRHFSEIMTKFFASRY